ncbi:MAG: S1 RNA-binding domain-containing protein [Lachnospiraceae bacterium]|nr:S1 RNA-binding domain-containing protein [Lachnospiraceae bacterium]
MIRIGERQVLTVIRKKDFGVYLGRGEGSAEDNEGVLLPAKQVPEGTQPGSRIEVFVYRDSSDRLIATTAEPKLTLGEVALLTAKENTKIGTFLDWGLEKDLFLPFKEQTCNVQPGRRYPAALYVDKSGRLAATMKIYDYLQIGAPYEKGDSVKGVVYQVNPKVGMFIAVDLKYHGMIPAGKYFRRCEVGEEVTARVVRVREDGKLELSFNLPVKDQIEVDSEYVMALIVRSGGVLPFTEKASPEVIEEALGMSKAAFKRAAGHLLKEGRVTITDGRICAADRED